LDEDLEVADDPVAFGWRDLLEDTAAIGVITSMDPIPAKDSIRSIRGVLRA
jgi:hypothetical protein